MATHHASPGEIINLDTWTSDLNEEKTKVIVKTDEMELARLLIHPDQEIPNHRVSGPITIYCVKGKIEFTAMGATQEISQGELLYLSPGEPHSVKALKKSVVLLTIIFN